MNRFEGPEPPVRRFTVPGRTLSIRFRDPWTRKLTDRVPGAVITLGWGDWYDWAMNQDDLGAAIRRGPTLIGENDASTPVSPSR